jgi:dimeric dUTPase (all-alpha-NTP-PPase superfamily)
MDKIFLMLQLQAQLNEATNGEDWTKGITKNAKEINWRRCIYMECAETIDSFSWKHWKSINKETDWENVQIEVVDIWHFIMSLAIEEYAKTMRGTVEDLAINIASQQSYTLLEVQNDTFGTQSEVIAKVEELMRLTLSKEEIEIERIVSEFFELVLLSGLDLQSLYRLYVGKNILNQLRQDNGYKEGTYIKEWDGKEDNVVMKELWEEDENLKPDVLYKQLTKLYLALTKS